MAKPVVLVIGGAGYIGSHVIVEVVAKGYHPVVIDNFSNSVKGSGPKPQVIQRLETITGSQIDFYEVDMADKAGLQSVFDKHTIDHVIHLAGLKAVGESLTIPIDYYRCNIGGTLNIIDVMKHNKCYNIIFSSSATVYGNPDYLPIDEKHSVGQGITNPYGRTKYFIEEILKDLSKAEKEWNVVLLRYFNPVGAHVSGMIGENPQGVPNNLMPFVAQVAVGKRPCVKVFGTDYDTPDGTGVRDYIHVVDLATGHVAALKKLKEGCGLKVYNLSSGNFYSVLDMIKAMEKASGNKIAYEETERREGDVPAMYGNPALAEKELEWKAARDLDKMCEDLWRWQSQNPNGYE
ncbi:UDP-glucose 4-epimerase-like [Diadema antillarum]|uniref:UDP-glucose 4-epimerase-like n=1 Tax=Diadema antillarum TaxID=105358 RepID=UPI003A876804